MHQTLKYKTRTYIWYLYPLGCQRRFSPKGKSKEKTVWKNYCHFDCSSKHRKIVCWKLRHTPNYYFSVYDLKCIKAQTFSNKKIPSFLKRARVCMFFIASFHCHFHSREKEIWRSYILMKCHATIIQLWNWWHFLTMRPIAFLHIR